MLNEWMSVMFMFQIKIGLFKNISVGLLLDKKIEYKGLLKFSLVGILNPLKFLKVWSFDLK